MAYEQESSLINGASNNTATSTPDTLQGGWTVASLSSSTDVDYFKVTTTSAALIKLDLSNVLLADTNYWSLSLLNGNGDYVTSLTSTVNGTPLVNGTNTGTSLAVSGLTSAVSAGSRFTFATSAADTTIYTVTSATTLSSGASTLTLDKTLPSGLSADTALVFDPAQSLAAGGTTSLTGQVSAAGSYFVKVSAVNWSDAEYSVRASVLPTVESTGGNDTKEAASDALTNNRLLANASMTGALSSSTDVDVWTFSTATMPADFTIDFVATTGNQTKPQWKVVVEQWAPSGTTPLLSATAVNISTATDTASTSGTVASFLVDDAHYTGAATYVVTVSAVSSSAYSTDAYQLKVSGAGLDQNDTPILTIDTATSSAPGILINTDVSRAVKAGADSKVALSTLFTASDPDVGQSIDHYKVALSKPIDETHSVAGSIVLIEADGSTSHSYVMNSTITLTAAEMAKAYLLPGTVTGNLNLALQAFDSSGALDNSGASSVMSQTLRVVSSDVGVTASNDGTLSLQEGNSASAETLSFALNTAPTGDVKVYLEQDSGNRFSFGTSVLTFTTENYATAQTVSVTARDNQITESAHTGQINFRVVSLDSQYDGYSITPLTVAITDAVTSTGKTADFMAYSWKAHTLLDSVSISDGTHSGTTDTSGAASFTAITDPSLTLTASRAIPTAEASATASAVNLQDAIAILKMIVGLDVNGAGKPLSPYQALAADFDGNGTVGLTDAIGVLKHVVGLTAPEPTWHFANEADLSVPAKTTLSPGLPQGTVTADLSGSSPVHVGLVGYLSGDVDGSYVGAAGALDLDATQPDYLVTLVGSHTELSLAQFGIHAG